jgi:DNA repair exonuclease SbcCD ATPase subunit
VEQLARQRDQAKAELEDCKLGQHRLKELAEAKEKVQEELRQATAADTRADSALAERHKAKEQLEKLNAQAEQLSAKAKELEESKAKAEAALADAEAELDRATKAKQAATQAAASAQATERACAIQAGLTKLKEQIEQARQALSEFNAATSQVKGIDDADIERLNKLQGELDKATAAQSAAAARVVVRRLGDASVSLDGTELEPEGQTEVRATDVVRIEAPGVAAIEVHPGLPSEQIDQQVNQASKALASALAKLDVSSLSEAQESATTRKNAKTQAATAKLKLTGILALATNQDPDSAIVQKEEELAGLEAEWEELHANHPDLAGAGQEQLKELTTKASQARDAAKQAEQDAAKAQKHLNAAKDTAAEARLAPVKTQTQADAATEAATKAATNLDNARQQASDADLATSAAKAEARLNAAKQQATQTAKAHKEAETDLEHRQRGAESAHEEANKAWHTAHTDLTSTNARLDTLAGQDTYEKQSDAAAALTAAHRNLTRLERQADAARLLREALLRHQAQTHQRYAPQFAEHLDRLAAAVFGPDCRIHLNDQLVITERTLAGRTVSFTSLSKGTQEQLALLSRLACAELIDPADGAPIVLDDTLGFADPDRLSALTDLLAHANAQVLLLTCQPARFANIPGARRVHLPNPQTHPAEHGT